MTTPRMLMNCRPPRRGTILVVTLWIIVILTGLVLTFAQSMRVEVIESSNHIAAVQASQVELGAEKYVLAMVDQLGSESLYQLEEDFQGVPIGLDPTDNTQATGYFWIVRPNYDEVDLPLFGLVDESSKLNLNTATTQQLSSLPSVWMTEELAAAIVDWRDTDETPEAMGAESDYYSTLSPPYMAKNADFETVEELLLVRDVTPYVLYGQEWMPTNPIAADTNSSMFGGSRSGPSAQGPMSGPGMGSSSVSSGTSNGAMFSDYSQIHGLYDYFTVFSNEPASSSSTTGTTSAARPSTSGQRTTGSTAQAAKPTRGLINVLTAPRDVLITLGLDDNDVNAIIQARSDTTLDRSSSSAWLGKVLPQKAASIENYVTVNSYQYSADIVAVSKDGRAFKRVRIVVDARTTPAIIVYRADITERGWPWQLPREYLDEMRAGTFVRNPIVTSNGPASTGAIMGSGGTGGVR